MTRSARRPIRLGLVALAALGAGAPGLALAQAPAAAAVPAPSAASTPATPVASPEEPVGPPPGGGRYTLFISPAGKPFRGAMTDPYPVEVWFAAADADHDGRLTRAEFRADAEAFFHQLDRDRSGVIETEEVSYYEKVLAPEIVAGFIANSDQGPAIQDAHRPYNGMTGDLSDVPVQEGSDPSAGGAPPDREQPQGAAWFSFMGEPEPVTASDGDFDGRITLKEFLKAADERFTELDPKGRGYLVLAELPHTPIQGRSRPQKPVKGKKRP